ncbi:MAG: ureidoglycolate dehydrogenase, partial [Proteobacteria bacterium]|nr:ureidoglycolate dehydrogenase [Pseudomonadota bacterium]
HFFIALDPTRFMTWEVFSDRMNQLSDGMRNARRIDLTKRIFIPGEPEVEMER